MKKQRTDLLQGSLDLLILKTLSVEAMHGWNISKRIQFVSADKLLVKQGSLYPCLHRLEEKAWIISEWGTSENNRKAKFYSLSSTGKTQLKQETEYWKEFTGAVTLILDMV